MIRSLILKDSFYSVLLPKLFPDVLNDMWNIWIRVDLETEMQKKLLSNRSRGVVPGLLLIRYATRRIYSGFRFYVEVRIFRQIDKFLFDFL